MLLGYVVIMLLVHIVHYSYYDQSKNTNFFIKKNVALQNFGKRELDIVILDSKFRTIYCIKTHKYSLSNDKLYKHSIIFSCEKIFFLPL